MSKSSHSRWLLWLSGAAGFALLAGYLLTQGLSSGHEQVRQGRVAYGENCASCHGIDLQGTPKGPPFIHKVYEPSHHSDEAFYRAVASGVRAHHWRFGDMPPVEGVSRDQVSDIISYIREQQRRNGIH